MEINTMLSQILIAIFAWAFVWLGREMHFDEKWQDSGFLWIRTNIFLAILWVVSTFFTTLPYMPAVLFVWILVLLSISHISWTFKLDRYWITAELWALIVFLIWVLIWFWFQSIAIILTIIISAVNTFRTHIDVFIDSLNMKEWLASLQLLVFSWFVLPILPNKPISDLLVWTKFELDITSLSYAVLSDINLFKIWLFVLFISWIWFVWYFLSKFIWAKWGIPISAFLWALSSSTAVTVSLASQEKQAQTKTENKVISYIFASGILIWIATMMLRVIFWIFVIGWLSMGVGIFYIPFVMSIFSLILAVYFFKKYSHEKKKRAWDKADIKLSSPFEIIPAIKFGLFYVMISVLMNTAIYFQNYITEKVSWLWENIPMYTISFISWFADVDAIYIKVSTLVSWDKMLASVWVITIVIAVLINTLVKTLYIKMNSSKYLAKLMFYMISAICIIWWITTYFVI